MSRALLYQDRPLFGLDIGASNMKVMQIKRVNKKHVVTGYGAADFSVGAISGGVIKDVEAVAQTANDLLSSMVSGKITAKRVALSIPAVHAFSRSLQLPKMGHKDLLDAVNAEAQQYIPFGRESIYIDYDIIGQTPGGFELLVVATPRTIVDSYVSLARLLGLEPVAIETTIGSSTRLFVHSEGNGIPTVLVDFGSTSTDITVHDREFVVTGTVPGGGESFNSLIAEGLKVSKEVAHFVKTNYGLGISNKQARILESLSPLLDQHVTAISRMIRYFEDRSVERRKIGQIVTMGGGANMPGLSEYLTSHLRLPVRMCDPWQKLDFGGLQPPNTIEKSMYITVAGLALMEPSEAFE